MKQIKTMLFCVAQLGGTVSQFCDSIGDILFFPQATLTFQKVCHAFSCDVDESCALRCGGVGCGLAGRLCTGAHSAGVDAGGRARQVWPTVGRGRDAIGLAAAVLLSARRPKCADGGPGRLGPRGQRQGGVDAQRIFKNRSGHLDTWTPGHARTCCATSVARPQ